MLGLHKEDAIARVLSVVRDSLPGCSGNSASSANHFRNAASSSVFRSRCACTTRWGCEDRVRQEIRTPGSSASRVSRPERQSAVWQQHGYDQFAERLFFRTYRVL